MRTDKKERLTALVGADLANQVESLVDDVNAKATEPDAIVKEAPKEPTPDEGVVAQAVARLKEVDSDLAEKLEKALAEQQTPPVVPEATKEGEPATDTSEVEEADETEETEQGLFSQISAMLATVKEQLDTVQKEVKELKGGEAPKAFTGIPEGIATVQVKDQKVEHTEKRQDYPEVVKSIGGTIVQVHARADE